MPHELSLAWAQQQLQPWVRWSERKLSDIPGIYILANFGSPPARKVDPLDKNVKCIGESRYLKYRLNQFDRTAFRDKHTHGPGWTYRRKKCGDEATLYVSTLPIQASRPEEEEESRAFRFALENYLLWQYVVLHRKLPCANSK